MQKGTNVVRNATKNMLSTSSDTYQVAELKQNT